MLTLTYDYGKVTEVIKVRLSVIVEEPKDLALKKGPKVKVVDRSMFLGAEYFRVAPHPYITIDISGGRDKGDDVRNPAWRVNLNRMYKHIFTSKLKKFISYYTDNAGLFYYDNGKLKVENQKSFVEEIKLQNNNTIRLMPMVVYSDPEVSDTACEGAFFMINNPDNSCTMTFTELEGLYEMMSNLDMDCMAVNLLMMYEHQSKDDPDAMPTIQITPTFPTRKPVSEEKPIEPPSSNTPAKVVETIPKLI